MKGLIVVLVILVATPTDARWRRRFVFGNASRYMPHGVPLDHAKIEGALDRTHQMLQPPLVDAPRPTIERIHANPDRQAEAWDDWPSVESGEGWSKRRHPDGSLRTILEGFDAVQPPKIMNLGRRRTQTWNWNHSRRWRRR